MPTLAPSCAQVILRLAASVNDPSPYLQQLYSSITSKADNDSRVAVACVAKLIEAITQASEDPDIGLSSYDLFKPGQLSSQLYAIMSSACLGDALKVATQYSMLLSDGAPLTYIEHDDSLTLQFLRMESLNVSRQYIDCCMSTMLAMTHWLLPWEPPVPVAATFSYARPNDCTLLESLFGENLGFSSRLNTITFSASDTVKVLATANPELKMYHLTHLNAEVSKRQCRITPIVRNIVFVGLNAGCIVSLDKTARELNFSSRTLQGRLEEESTCFKDIVDQCRRDIACQLLSTTAEPVVVISEKLSFRGTSSFHKACVRWFGCSPGHYRNAVSAH